MCHGHSLNNDNFVYVSTLCGMNLKDELQGNMLLKAQIHYRLHLCIIPSPDISHPSKNIDIELRIPKKKQL